MPIPCISCVSYICLYTSINKVIFHFFTSYLLTLTFQTKYVLLDIIYYEVKTYKFESFYEPFVTKFFYVIMLIFQASYLSHKLIKAQP